MPSDKEKRLLEIQEQIEYNQELSQKLFNEEQLLLSEASSVFVDLLKESGIFSKYEWELSIDNCIKARSENFSVDITQVFSSESRTAFRRLFSFYNYHHNLTLDAGVTFYFNDDTIFLRIDDINKLPEIANTFGLKIKFVNSSKVMERYQFVVNLLDKIK